MDSACICFTILHHWPLVQTKGWSKRQSTCRVVHRTDCIPFKIQLVQDTSRRIDWPCRLLIRIDGQQTKPQINLYIHLPSIACVLEHLQRIVSVGLGVRCLDCRCDPQAFPSSDISAKKGFPKAQQTQVVPRDHHPIMQECWQQKELMAPRQPKLNIVICKLQSNLFCTCFFTD